MLGVITECHGIQEMGYCMSGLGCVSIYALLLTLELQICQKGLELE